MSGVPYDVFLGGFLSKITEYELLELIEEDRTAIVEGYMKRAISSFKKVCKYDLVSTADDNAHVFNIDVRDEDLDELVDIISEGMVVQWLKPYLYHQELLRNAINSRDWTTYSPAELLMRVGNAYSAAQKNYTQMIREYSYNHGDLTNLHL